MVFLQLEPSWRVLDQFNLVVQSALSQDDTINARPMTRDLTTPSELNGSFDYVPYAKSASVIRMMQTTLGINEFRQALRQYIDDR
jgi:aminopeptidase N